MKITKKTFYKDFFFLFLIIKKIDCPMYFFNFLIPKKNCTKISNKIFYKIKKKIDFFLLYGYKCFKNTNLPIS